MCRPPTPRISRLLRIRKRAALLRLLWTGSRGRLAARQPRRLIPLRMTPTVPRVCGPARTGSDRLFRVRGLGKAPPTPLRVAQR